MKSLFVDVRSVSINSVLTWISISTIFVSGLYAETAYGVFFYSYFLMIICYLFLIVKNRRLGYRKDIFLFLYFLLLISLLNVISTKIHHDDALIHVFSMLVKIGMLVFFIIYYVSIFNICGKSVRALFSQYIIVANFFAWLGIIQQIVFFLVDINIFELLTGGGKNYGTFLGVAVLSVEPAFYALCLLPAATYYLSRFIRCLKISFSGVIIILAILFSTSALGYLGLFISAAITFFVRLSIKRIGLLLLITIASAFITYKAINLEFIKIRVSDTILVLQGGELTMEHGMNLSTYANSVNTSIAMKSIRDNYGFGAGFGMYSSTYDKYIDGYELPTYRADIPGRGSATSMFARLTAEIGVIAWGLLMVAFYWLIDNIRKKRMISINIAYMSTLLIILIRMGEYYANGVILVFLMIYLLRKEVMQEMRMLRLPIRYFE